MSNFGPESDIVVDQTEAMNQERITDYYPEEDFVPGPEEL